MVELVLPKLESTKHLNQNAGEGEMKMSETKHIYPTVDEIEDVRIVWNEYGYKLIEVELKNGECYMVESD